MSDLENTKYNVQFTSRFKKEFKKMLKQGKDENLFLEVLNVIANGGKLAEKYKIDVNCEQNVVNIYENHKLVNDKVFNECYECHIQPDWLLVYKLQDNKLVLLLFATGSHSDLFNK